MEVFGIDKLNKPVVGSFDNDYAAQNSNLWSCKTYSVGGTHCILIVLNNYNGVAEVAKLLQGFKQFFIVSLMQTISPGFEPSGPWLVILSSLGLCVAFALIHIWLIRRKIRS